MHWPPIVLIVSTILVFAVPYNAAIHAALGMVRSDSVRLTPSSPWEMFSLTIGRKLRLWRWVWWIGGGVVLLAMYGDTVVWLGLPPLVGLSWSLFLGLFVIDVGLLFSACALLLCPRIGSPVVTLIAGLVISLVGVVAFALAARVGIGFLGVPQTVYIKAGGTLAGITFEPLEALPFVLGIALYYRMRVRRSGARWFRFEG